MAGQRLLHRRRLNPRVYGRTREARNIAGAARTRAFSGQARAATSSFISPDHLDWYSDVALELWAMAAPTEGVPARGRASQGERLRLAAAALRRFNSAKTGASDASPGHVAPAEVA